MRDFADEIQAHRPRTLEEVLTHWPTVMQAAKNSPNPWVHGFVADIAKRRRWRNWKPTPKQLAIMQRLVTDLFREAGADADDFEVIERCGG